jgi:hypothetical protein
VKKGFECIELDGFARELTGGTYIEQIASLYAHNPWLTYLLVMSEGHGTKRINR